MVSNKCMCMVKNLALNSFEEDKKKTEKNVCSAWKETKA